MALPVHELLSLHLSNDGPASDFKNFQALNWGIRGCDGEEMLVLETHRDEQSNDNMAEAQDAIPMLRALFSGPGQCWS